MIGVLAATQTAITPGAAQLASQMAFYLGTAALIGIGTALALGAGQRRLRRPVTVAWVIAATGATMIATDAYSTFSLPLTRFLTTTLGQAAAARILGLVIAYAGTIAIAQRRNGTWLVLSGGVLAAAAHATGGHANSSPVPAVAILMQSAHIVGVGVWLGGLGAILLATRGAPDGTRAALIARFSRIAGVTIVLVAATGVVRAVDMVGTSVGALTETTYGRFVLFKAELLIALAAFGAHNRYVEVPRAHRILRGLRRAAAAELALGIIILGATSMLRGTEPAKTAYAQIVAARAAASGAVVTTRPLPIGVTAYEAAYPDGASVQAYLDPEAPGVNELHLTFFDPDGTELAMRELRTEVGGIETPAADIERLTPGHFSIRIDLGLGQHELEVGAIARGGRRFAFSFPLQID